MRRFALAPLVLLLFLASPVLGADEDDPKAFLAAARQKHADLTARGLRSFSAVMELRRSEDENLRRNKDAADFGYSWSAPSTEEFDFEKTLALLRKPLRDVVKDYWRSVTGVLFFDILEAVEDLSLSKTDGYTVLTGTTPQIGELRASFEDGTSKLVELEVVKRTAKVSWTYASGEGAYRVASRDVSVGGNRIWRSTLGVFRRFGGYRLPTVLTLETDKNVTEFAVRYTEINGEPPRTEAPDEEEVKSRVREFEKAWKKWSESMKVDAIRTLAETPHDLASEAIAKHGLRDRSPFVRQEAAEALGIMKRKNVVKALIAAMKKNEDQIDVYLRVIQSLGEIGDERAVPILSKDWWNQKGGENALAATKAKLRALGGIRHKSAVDALIDTFYVVEDKKLALFAADILAALKRLTGKDFGADRPAWKDWWKKNRARHRFD